MRQDDITTTADTTRTTWTMSHIGHYKYTPEYSFPVNQTDAPSPLTPPIALLVTTTPPSIKIDRDLLRRLAELLRTVDSSDAI